MKDATGNTSPFDGTASLESTPRTTDASGKQFQLGGQALIEGVMMRSPRFVGAAVRRMDGSIETKVEPVQTVMQRYPVLKLPFIRGVVALFEMLGLGMRYLNWSSNLALQDQKVKDEAAKADEAKAQQTGQPSATPTPGQPLVNPVPGDFPNSSNGYAHPQSHAHGAHPQHDGAVPVGQEAAAALMTNAIPLPVHVNANGSSDPAATPQAEEEALPLWMFLLTVAFSLSFGMMLFVALPNLITDWTLRRITDNLIALNLFEGLVKLLIFIGYVWVIGTRPDIRRVFEYHGAEHKVVYAVENHQPITPAGARPFDTPHPRCGTGFALLTVLVSIVCFSFLPWTESHLIRVGMRLALMPVVAGLSYEVIKMTTHPRWGKYAQFVMTPGLWLQRMTTHQPDDEQLEVSCVAMRVVLAAEEEASRLQQRVGLEAEPVARPAAI